MIFLHTSDWHLGATEGEYDLLEDQYYFVDEICRIISERKVDAVLLAGDVYDRSVASAGAAEYRQSTRRAVQALPCCPEETGRAARQGSGNGGKAGAV